MGLYYSVSRSSNAWSFYNKHGSSINRCCHLVWKTSSLIQSDAFRVVRYEVMRGGGGGGWLKIVVAVAVVDGGAGGGGGATLSLSSLWSMPLSRYVVDSEHSDSESPSTLRSLICTHHDDCFNSTIATRGKLLV